MNIHISPDRKRIAYNVSEQSGSDPNNYQYKHEIVIADLKTGQEIKRF